MEELLSLETTSIFSSIAEAPVRLEQQYSPLTEAFQSHGAYLPDQDVPEPNSEGAVYLIHNTCTGIHVYTCTCTYINNSYTLRLRDIWEIRARL